MRVRRAAAVTGLALGLALGSTPGWADEPTPDPGCTTYPVDETDPGAGEGEATAEPGPVEESPVEPGPTEEPGPSEEPAPEETEVPPTEPTEEPSVDPSEEPAEPGPTEEPEASEEPGEPGPEPSEYVVCLYTTAGEAVRDTGGSGAAEAAGGGTTAAEQLPRTGAASVDLFGLGAGLVLVGAGAVAAGRRRRA